MNRSQPGPDSRTARARVAAALAATIAGAASITVAATMIDPALGWATAGSFLLAAGLLTDTGA